MLRTRGLLLAGCIVAGVMTPGIVVAAPDVLAPSDILRAIDAGDWQWARSRAVDVGGTAFATYVRWRELNDAVPTPPFASFRAFLDDQPGWPGAVRLQARAEDALDDTVADAEVLAFFAGREPLTRQGKTRLALAAMRSGDDGRATRLARDAWVTGNFSDKEESFFLAQLGDRLRVADHRARLSRLLDDGRRDEARRQAQRLDAGRRLLADARIRVQTNATGVAKAVAAVPDALKADPGLTLDRIKRARRNGLDELARDLLVLPRSAADMPDTWWQERQIQIRDRLDAKDYAAAYRLAATHRQPKDDSSYGDAEWLSGWIALRFLNKPTEARKHFAAIEGNVASPISVSRAAYWLGRAEVAAGHAKRAEAAYRRAAAIPTAFYGQLAALELATSPAVPAASFPDAGAKERKAFEQQPVARVAKLLCADRAGDEAGPLLSQLVAISLDDPVRLGLAADLATECKRLDTVVQTARLAQRSGRVVVAAAFPPPPFAPLAQKGEPEPSLITAIARQESQFHPGVRSPAGALGLLQLMPATAKAMARESGIAFTPARLLTDPSYNVSLGRTYLDLQLQRWGEPALAIAAYNAGPARVSSWLDRYGDPRGKGIDALIDWIELIPFSETRNYVQRVLEGRNVYRLRFGWDTTVEGHPFELRATDPS